MEWDSQNDVKIQIRKHCKYVQKPRFPGKLLQLFYVEDKNSLHQVARINCAGLRDGVVQNKVDDALGERILHVVVNEVDEIEEEHDDEGRAH